MSREEAIIQGQIVKYLELRGIAFFSVPNESAGAGRGAMIRMKQYKAMGLRPGAPDLVVLYPPGTVTFVEVKTATGRQSQHQKNFQRLASEAGINYVVVRSVEDVVDIIEGR
jgi:hypothetical protein